MAFSSARFSSARRLRGLFIATVAAALGAAGGCGEDELVSEGGGGFSASSGTDDSCAPVGEPCPVTFDYPIGTETSVELRGDFKPDGWEVGIPLTIDAGTWRVTVPIPNGTRVQYKFFVDGALWVTDPSNPAEVDDGLGGKSSVLTVACGTCADGGNGNAGPGAGPGPGSGPGAASSSGAGAGLPEGAFDWRSSVMYFVFVDRFRNGDPSNDAPVAGVETPANYQGGDYAGLLQAIEEGYFTDLGVNTLWLTVPMNNPSVAGIGSDGRQYSAYHGYWPTDLQQVEEQFGTMDLLKDVVDEAHDRDIKVLIDYAMNHVHIDAPIFQDHPDWFWPLDNAGRYCVCGDQCDWNGDDGRRCWFTGYLPDWNFQNPDARAASVDNAMWWIEQTGIDGFRLDAVKHIETIWIEELRNRVRAEVEEPRGEKFYMVGETFDTGNRDLLKQYVGPNLLDGQFDFPHRGAAVEAILRRGGTMFDLDGFLSTNDSFYDPGIMSTFLGNHDIARVIHTAEDSPWGTWDNGGSAAWEDPPDQPTAASPYERLAVGFTFLMTTKGVPLIYYGDEIGLAGAGDPDNRRMMPWEDVSEAQEALRTHLSALGAIRKANPALWGGVRTTVFVSNDTYAYRMSDGTNPDVWVALNRGDAPGSVEGLPASATDLLTGDVVAGPTVTLPPRSSMVLAAAP